MLNLELKQKLDKTVDSLVNELRSVRVGRASADMVEHISVEVYGSNMPMLQVASIQVPEHNQIIIQPWDIQILNAIATALRNSELNINPVVEGNIIRLTIPPVTEEGRHESVKRVHKLTEEARIAVRNIRDAAMKDIEGKERSKALSEDAAHRAKEEVQKAIDGFNHAIKELSEKKEAEIMPINNT